MILQIKGHSKIIMLVLQTTSQDNHKYIWMAIKIEVYMFQKHSFKIYYELLMLHVTHYSFDFTRYI